MTEGRPAPRVDFDPDDYRRLEVAVEAGGYDDVGDLVREGSLRLVDELVDEDGQLECPHEDCDRIFATIRQRRGHLGNVHADVFPDGDFWCGYCGFGPTAWRGVNAHHAHRHGDQGDPVRLDHDPDQDELLAPDDIPDHMDRELLERLYRENGGSISELYRSRDFDVQQGRVRHYLIEFGIHEPTPHGSSDDGPDHRNREFLEQQYERFGGNISEMHRELDLDVSYRGLVNILKRWEVHDATDPPGKRHGKGGPKPSSTPTRTEAEDGQEDDTEDDWVEDVADEPKLPAESSEGPADGLDVDFDFGDGFETVVEREERSSDRVVGDPFCPSCGSVYAGDGLCESCSENLEEDLVADGGRTKPREPFEENKLYRRALELLGLEVQLDVAVEEAAELVVDIQHWRRDRNELDDLVEEIVDVELVLEQLKTCVDQGKYRDVREQKLDRLERRLDEGANL